MRGCQGRGKTAGMQLDKINADGDGTVLYPSGRTAVTVCRSPDGFFHTFIADKDDFQVLCCFDTEGVGSVNYAQGNPWLITSKDGWMLCSKEGRIQERGSWPRTAKELIICEVTPELTVTFANRQNITAAVRCADVSRNFQVGEYLRRSEPCKVLRDDKGQLQVDLAAIRQRIETTGSVYTPPGPHRFITPQPGLGNLKRMISNMAVDSPIRATISELDLSQARIAGLTTLKQPMYGTIRTSSRSSSRPSSRSTAPADGGSSAADGGGDGDGAADEAPYGSPVLTPAQQKLAAKLKKAEVAKPNYTIKRHRLPLITVKQLRKLLGPDAPADTLCAVAILASWNPVCTKLEHYQLQAAYWELQQSAAGQGSGSGGSSQASSASSGSSSSSLRPADAAHIQVFKVDGSESRELQQQYSFRTIPMFLMFYQGRLVSAGNGIRTKEQFIEAVLAALAAGRRGDFLPDGFKFKGDDDAILDTINKDMSLLGAVASS